MIGTPQHARHRVASLVHGPPAAVSITDILKAFATSASIKTSMDTLLVSHFAQKGHLGVLVLLGMRITSVTHSIGMLGTPKPPSPGPIY